MKFVSSCTLISAVQCAHELLGVFSGKTALEEHSEGTACSVGRQHAQDLPRFLLF